MLRPTRSIVFRPQGETTLGFPLTVRSAGHYVLGPRETPHPSVRKYFYQLFWIAAGEGAFAAGRQTLTAGEGDVFLYKPGEHHVIRAGEHGWEYGWLTLATPNSKRFVAALPPRGRCWQAGPYPADWFSALEAAVGEPGADSELRASALAYRILVAAWFGARTRRQSREPASLARDLFLRNYDKSDYGIDNVANELDIHRATLFRLFKKAHGKAPAEFLRGLRLERALDLLRETNLPVAEVARRSGFADPDYLARVVRQTCGDSPRKIRLR